MTGKDLVMECESSSRSDPNYVPRVKLLADEQILYLPRSTTEKCQCGRFERFNMEWHTMGPCLVWKDCLRSSSGIFAYVYRGYCPDCGSFLPSSGEPVIDSETGEVRIAFA